MSSLSPAILFALLLLISLVLAARTYLGWRRLMALSAGLAARADALDRRIDARPTPLEDARLALGRLNVAAEHELWRLSEADARLDAAMTGLRSWRASLENARTSHLVAADDLLAKTRTVARVVRTGIEVRRSLGI